MFRKILIANRGEIALRVLRACQEMGIATVAAHSTADSKAMHVRLADESVCIGPPPSHLSYSNIPSLLAAAEITGADAIHPGIGFLSENARFAKIVQEHDITFIGPSFQHIALMGNKITAKKEAVESIGLSVIPSSPGVITDAQIGQEIAEQLTYPVLIKAAEGGGGKGMKLVTSSHEFREKFELAQAESLASFGNADVYLEKYLKNPRHVEFQVLGDHYGHVVHLGERDCSLQRSHQKILEEAPCPVLTEKLRLSLGEKICQGLRKIGYHSLGTLEFLFEDGQFYFLEMNTRLQVEHCVTEMLTGIDLVKEQIHIAAGHPLSFKQEDVTWMGHAIECRINAEHPETFVPSPGTIQNYLPPGGPFVRVDSALYAGYEIPPYYDSLVAKLIVYGHTRQKCLERLRRALNEYVLTGIESLLPLHRLLAAHPDVIAGHYSVSWLEQFLEDRQKEAKNPPQDGPVEEKGPQENPT